ncbi:MAG: hypothetical protein SNJ79_11645 [Sphingomonadaceae bacterium]
MSDYLHWRERRRPRAGIRHDDGPIPDEWARRVARDRPRAVVWIGVAIAAFLYGWAAVGYILD